MGLKSAVTSFKSWAASQAQDYGEWEVDYPEWPSLLTAVEETLSKSELDDDEVGLLLYALARDNECELIRGMLDKATANGLRLARVALSYPEPDARWQIADFLGTQDEPEAKELLRRFVEDSDEYVRRRALLAAQKHDPAFAEETARRWVTSAHDYSRLAALSVLYELRSRHLKHALERLQDDPFVYVRQKAAEIAGEV